MTRPFHNRTGFTAALSVLIGLALWLSAHGRVQAAEVAAEADVKAALLNAFCRLTDWPEERAPVEGRPVVIGFVQAPEIMAAFKREFPDEGLFRVVAVSSGAAARECHLVYFGGLNSEATSVLRDVPGDPVLTVGELEGFVDAGGIIAFERREGRVAYRVNLRAMDKAGVRLNPRLVRNAVSIEGDRP